MTIASPAATEFAQFYAGYISQVPDSGPVADLQAQITQLESLRGMSEDQGNYRYAEGKWSVKEVIGHLSDAERVFGYRLIRIVRADTTPLAGFDENAWAEAAPHSRRTMRAVVDELIAVRRATLALLDSIEENTLSNTSLANNNPVSARAICWILAGHSRHHLNVLAEKYGVKY